MISNDELQGRFIELHDFKDELQIMIRDELKRRGLGGQASSAGFVRRLHDDVLGKVAARIDSCPDEIRSIILDELRGNREKLLKHFREFPGKYEQVVKMLGMGSPTLTTIAGQRATPELLDRPPCRFLTQSLRRPSLQQPFQMKSFYTLIGFGAGYFAFYLLIRNDWFSIVGGGLGAAVGSLVSHARYRAVRCRGLEHWHELTEADHNNVDALIQMAMWTQGVEERLFVGEARSLLEDALIRVPGQRDATIMLATGLMNANDPQSAIAVLRPWLERTNDFQGEAICAEALEMTDNFQEAAFHYRRMVGSLPNGDEKKRIDAFLEKYDP